METNFPIEQTNTPWFDEVVVEKNTMQPFLWSRNHKKNCLARSGEQRKTDCNRLKTGRILKSLMSKGNFQNFMANISYLISNQTNGTITNVCAAHSTEAGTCDSTLYTESLANGSSSSSSTFAETQGGNDYWFVSFLDSSGSLWCGWVKNNYSVSAGNVTISVNPGANTDPNFSVVINSGNSANGTYDQNKVG